MPDGGQRLGERIRGWLEDLWERLNLKGWADDRQTSTDEWNSIRNLADLDRWVAKWGRGEPLAIAAKAREIGATPEQIVELIEPGAEAWVTDPSKFMGVVLQRAFASPLWTEVSEMYGSLIIDPWLATMVGDRIPVGAPEIDNIRRFLGSIKSFEALGTAVSGLGEAASLGQLEDLGRMFTDAKWTLGTCFTSWQSTSPIVQATILEPLQRLINHIFRPADFTRSQWMDLLALGKISNSRLGEELARLGYSNEKIQWLIDLAERQPSRSDLLTMWRKDIIGPVQFADGLRKEGYGSEWIDRYMRLYQLDETDEDKGAYIGTLRKAFKEQLISESQFRDALKKQGRSNEAINLEIAVLKLGWEVEVKTAAKSDVRAAYMEDVIGRPEAARALTEAGFASHTIDLLLTTWDKQRAPSYRQINKSEALKAWGLGVISQSETYQLLISVGYDERGATVLMETYAKAHLATKPPEGGRLRTTDIMNAWHAEVIDDAETQARLVELGLSEGDARLLFETFRRLHPRVVAKPPKELQKNDILDAWGRGVINEATALDKLVTLTYSAEDAAILIDSYAARPEALPPEPTIAELIGATRRGVITPAVLSQRLTVMGLRVEDVQFYVTYATTPLPESTRSLSRTDILALWVQGRHDRAWALERLLGMNYSPEDAEDILWLASPEIKDTETYILWKAGFIDDDTAWAMWSAMGFSDEQIAAVLGAE
jgi:hypothetical protein